MSWVIHRICKVCGRKYSVVREVGTKLSPHRICRDCGTPKERS